MICAEPDRIKASDIAVSTLATLILLETGLSKRSDAAFALRNELTAKIWAVIDRFKQDYEGTGT